MASHKISIKALRFFLLFIFQFLFFQNLIAVPLLISFQGQVINDGRPYEGVGDFKFAFLGSSGEVLWRNDGLIADGEPSKSIQIEVLRGVFSIVLGDETIPNMASLDVDVFNQDNINVRIWFNDGEGAFDLISPDTRITSVGFALKAKTVDELPENIVDEPNLSSNLKSKIQSIQQLDNGLSQSNEKIDQLTSEITALQVSLNGKTDELKTSIATLEAATNKKVDDLNAEIAALEGSSIAKITALEVSSSAKIAALEVSSNAKIAALEVSSNEKTDQLDDELIALQASSNASSSLFEARISVLETKSLGPLNGVFTSLDTAVDGYRKIHTFSVDSWSSFTTEQMPTARYGHSSVWSGSEMIIWGGELGARNTYLRSGGSYNSDGDLWSELSVLGAPMPRSFHSSIWFDDQSGGNVLIWGGLGESGVTSTGGIYRVSTKSWRPISNNGSPPARYGNAGIWNGSRMLVWGGRNNGGLLNDCYEYDPSTDEWQEILINDNQPEPRYLCSAVLVGSKVIVWGGVGAGGAFGDGFEIVLTDPNYSSISMTGSPEPRSGHTAISTGDKMLIWGGKKNQGQLYSDGFIYDPSNDTWSPMSTVNAPSARENHVSVWTGEEMLIIAGLGVGGVLSDSHAYNPQTNSWRQLKGSVGPRYNSKAVWTGKHVLVFGGDDGQKSIAAPVKLNPDPAVSLYVKE